MFRNEDTIRAQNYQEWDTLPMQCADVHLQIKVPKLKKETHISEYTLLNPMSVTVSSELWFAKDSQGETCVVKFFETCGDMDLLKQIKDAEHENLVRILAFGRHENLYYEVYPFYRKGSLKGPMSEDKIKEIVLPGLIKALKCLHSMKIIHNDIKPENIFWDDAGQTVLLGDYGSIGRDGIRPKSYTPSYAAPEIMLNAPGSRQSDWFSVGMTLAALMDGKPLIEESKIELILRQWENGVRVQNGSSSFKQLITGMIQLNKERRLGPSSAAKWCGDALFGGQEHRSKVKPAESKTITIRFENPVWVAADTASLLKGIETHWDYSVFIFYEGKMNPFLRQLGNDIVVKSKEFQLLTNKEDALFRLTIELTGGKQFLWRGKAYRNLLDLEYVWDSNQKGQEDVLTFLQLGLVSVFLKRKGADEAQLDFVKRLEDLSYRYPTEACSQLFQALRGNDDFVWGNDTISDLNMLVDWLTQKASTLDQEIEELFASKRFEAWLAYHGMSNIIDEIRRKCSI